MHRRSLLQLAGVTALSACVGPRRPVIERGVRAVAFDLFTLFDPTTVDRRIAAVVTAPAAFATTWKTRLFEASWQHAAGDRYVRFDRLVDDALAYACRAHDVVIAPGDRTRLSAAFTELDPWPDTRTALTALRARGFQLATLANFSPTMIDALLARANLTALFDARISTDEARTYKPDPRAYALAEQRLALPRAQVAFAAFGPWDATGAAWFGLPTFWVNRFGNTADEPAVASGPDLAHLERWLDHPEGRA